MERPLGLVPTMGALHEGHLALVRRAKQENRTLAATIFVNPTQFGPEEDLQQYPRDLERDLDLLRTEGVDLVYTPGVEEVYPTGFNSWVEVTGLGDRLEGAHRPGHFRGVATVVTKLFNLIQPDRAYFGQKDGQQTAIVRKMVKDLDFGLDIVVVPTVRDSDGLALSSRNVYLTPEQRRAAPVIYRSLCAASHLWSNGVRDGDRLEVRSPGNAPSGTASRRNRLRQRRRRRYPGRVGPGARPGDGVGSRQAGPHPFDRQHYPGIKRSRNSKGSVVSGMMPSEDDR